MYLYVYVCIVLCCYFTTPFRIWFCIKKLHTDRYLKKLWLNDFFVGLKVRGDAKKFASPYL